MKQRMLDAKGKLIGWLDEQPNGDIMCTDAYGRLKGWYRKQFDATDDAYGRLVARGNVVASLLYR